MSARRRVGFIDSGLGLVPFADALHQAAPDIDLVLAMDPDWMPYGALTGAQVTERALASAAALEQWQPDAIVVACNTASVNALPALRARFEPEVPVIGTVPAIKSAANAGRPFAVWATTATTGSAYQDRLIAEFSAGIPVTPVACPGLAQAIDRADDGAIETAIDVAVSRTPEDLSAIVLGCTHYGLVADRIVARRPQTAQLFDSPAAVAAQTLNRLGRAAQGGEGAGDPGAVLAVYASGRPTSLPTSLTAYPAGRRLLTIERTQSWQ